MKSQPVVEHPAAQHDPCPTHNRPDCPVHLDSRGWCWFGDHYPAKAKRPALSIVETKPQVEGELAMETAVLDPETGEVGQMTLGDDPAFVRVPRRQDVPVIKVGFTGTVEITQEDFEALTDGKELAPGRIVYIRASAYMPGPHAAWVKRTEKDEETGERATWWEHEGRLGLKVVEVGGLDVTDREWEG